VPHYDVLADAAGHGLFGRAHVTGFVPDDELGAYLGCADICACLRWPTNGETSASWWRAVAAGRPTIITDLSHQPELPVVDPRNWRRQGPTDLAPIAVAVPILDEHAALVSAIAALARSADRRAKLGEAARAYWQSGHTLNAMADAYGKLLSRAASRPAPVVDLPAHLTNAGAHRLGALLAPFGLDAPPAVGA
jgi:hypothetical protein